MQSPLFDGNNHYAHWCFQCVNDLHIEYTNKYGSEEEAMRRVCQILDVYYSKEVFCKTDGSSVQTPMASAYIKYANLRQYQGKTWDDTIDEEKGTKINSEEDLVEAKSEGAKVSMASLKRWGTGFTVEEYKTADDLYQMLQQANPKADGVQKTYMQDLVRTKILQQRAFVAGDADEYTKYMKAYQDTFKNSKLKMSVDDDGDMMDENACWGKFLQSVEQYTPAQLYKKGSLFDDVDGIKDYFKRYIVRPFKNFFTGSTEQDAEFSVLPGEEEE